MEKDQTDDKIDAGVEPDWFDARIARHRLSLTADDRSALREALPKLERLALRLRRPMSVRQP